MSQKTEENIINTAIDLFIENGIEQTHFRDVARKAGVGKSTLYRYFSSKQQLVDYLLEKIWQKLADGLNILAESRKLDPLEKIDYTIDFLTGLFSKNPKLSLIFFNMYNPTLHYADNSLKAHYDNYINSLKKIFREGIKQRFISESLHEDTFIHFFDGGIKNIICYRATSEKNISLSKMQESLKQQLKHGLIRW